MEENTKTKIFDYLNKSKKKLDSAEKILKQNLYEDAISRAYYSMFHASKALLLTKNLDSKTHSGLIAMLNMHFVRTGLLKRELLQKLTYGRDLRENGDYATNFQPDIQDAKISIDNARAFLSEVEKIVANVTKESR